ncbi:RD3 domain-containing protein [Hypomesus transpacificus]|uniref:RD3 domain-containing protein n=1 Tax=Hypomesus transpacificus TaxID=137520 RepID=UPI001F0762E9|nr:RD3 domain-containing protein [Hypomesus transpacificus]
MFPWSAVFSLEPKVPGQRTAEELVTNTLMLELGAMVKRTERIRLERATEGRRRRSSSSADYSWLAAPPAIQPYELTPRDLLELQDLCAKVPPPECGPVIARFRKLVTEMEPDVHEVPRLFRTVLLDTVEGTDTDENLRLQAARFDKQRSKSLSFVSFRSKFRTIPFRGGALGGSRGNLQEEASWYEEDEVDEEEEVNAARGAKRGRSRSMPDITPIEQSAQG